MYIETIFIESFGSLSSISYDLTSGVNIFRGKNESGKSTLAAFIKFIFYGLCGNTPDAAMSEKERYTNWEHGVSGGSLVINTNGIRYRIERRVSPDTAEYVKVIDLISGTEVFAGKCPGEVFFGVGADIFSETAFSAQGSGSVVDSERMNTAIDNILLSGNESLNVKGAIAKLTLAKEALLSKDRKSGEISDMATEMENLESRIAKAKENAAFLVERHRLLSENRHLLEANHKQLKKIDDAIAHNEAAAVLERFAELDKKEAECDEAAKRHEVLIRQYTHEGFLPDKAYPTALKALYAEIGITDRERASLKQQKEAFEKTTLNLDQRSVLAALEKEGGKKAALDTIEAYEKKRHNRRRFAISSLVLSLLFAVLSLLLTFTEIVSIPYAAYAAYGVTALFLLLAAIGLFTLPSLTELYRPYLADNKEDALRKIDDALSAENAIREEDGRFGKLMDHLDGIENQRAELENQAKHLLAKWNHRYETPDSLLTVAEKAETALHEIEAARVTAEGAKIAYQAAFEALKDLSRIAYQQTFAETAYVEVGTKQSADMLLRNRSFCMKKEEALASQIRSIELDIATRSALYEDPDELLERLDELKRRYNDAADTYKAYMMAHEAIRKASERVKARIAPTLSASASALMKTSTEGKYADIAIDSEMSFSFRTDASSPSRSLAYMSAGTKALTYISLRLSLIRLLFRQNLPPCVFDESFSWLDNTRLTAMMSLLSTYSADAQVIVLTCCDREYECSDKENVNLIDIKQ